MEICGKCLHDKEAHTESHNFMYCATCFKLCDTDEFNLKHKPTDIRTVMEMASKKQ